MKTVLGIYYFIFILSQGVLKELVFRTISIIFFPIAYILRWKIRKHIYSVDKILVEERVFNDTQYESTGYFLSAVSKVYFFLWLFLDDSPAKDDITEVRARTFNISNTWDSPSGRDYYPSDFVHKNRYLRNIWFSFIRNNSVNFVSWFRTGGWDLTKKVKTITGTYSVDIDKNDDNTKYIPGYYIALIEHNNGNKYPFFTYVGEIFNRKVGIWMGRDSGSGRFSFSIRA